MAHAAGKGYDTRDFVEHYRRRVGGSAINGRTVLHPGYGVSMRKRKQIEQCFGWAKTIGGLRHSMFRGLDRVDQRFTLAMAAYNLMRMRTLVGA